MSTMNALQAAAPRGQSRRNESLILSASLVSTLGSGILTIANALVISQTMGTAKAVGTLFILIALPQAFFSVLFGKLADTFNRKTICLVTNLLNTVIVIGVLAGIKLLPDPAMVIYVSSFLLSMTLAMFFPANNAMIKDSVSTERMGLFNSRMELALQVGALTSVAIGGFMIQLIGVDFVYVLNALTFLTSAMLFIFIRPFSREQSDIAKNGVAVDGEQKPPFRKSMLMLLYGTGNVIVTVSNMLLIILVTHHFASGAGVLGLIDALAGLGVAIAAMLSPWLQKRFRLLTLVLVGYIGDALFIALQPQFSLFWLIVFFPLGALCFGLARISCRTMMFELIPSDYTGRFFGLSNALGLIMAVALTYLIGDIVDRTTVLSGYLILAIAVVMIASASSMYVFKGRTP